MTEPNIQGVRSPSSPREGLQKVFVYGTLKKAYHNHKWYLGEARDLGPATIEGLMFHLGSFPAINLAESFCTIHGEVYEATWEQITAMDHLEGVSNGFYTRIQATVKPHGVVWMYIFTHDRAGKEEWLIPGGRWEGPETNKVKWLGFGKGVEVGAFEARLAYPGEIKIGPGDSPYTLRRSGGDDTYKLIDKKTGEILGSYKYLRDMTSKDGTRKPVLRLPAVARPTPEQPLNPPKSAEITVIGPRPVDQHPHIPIVWTPDQNDRDLVHTPAPVEEKIPQAAKLLGLKYGEA